MAMSLADLEAHYPDIAWREPIKIATTDGSSWHYACRICVANTGISGRDVTKLPTDPNAITEHITRSHTT